MDKKWIVYKYTDKHNGLIYIGITCQTLEKRWKAGYKANRRLYNSIKKYGDDNFIKEILFENLTKEEACAKEIEMIAFYDATNPKIGYNISMGGTAPMAGRKHSKKARKKMSETQMGENNGFYGKHHNREAILNTTPVICLNDMQHFHSISLAADHYTKLGYKSCLSKNIQHCISDDTQLVAGKDLNGNPLFWEKYNHEYTLNDWEQIYKYKLKKYLQVHRDTSKKSYPIIELTTKEIYFNALEASYKTGEPRSTITSCCNGSKQIVNGKIYCYLEKYMLMTEQERKDYVLQKKIKTKGRAVVCLNTRKFYQNVLLASKDTDSDKDVIHKVCLGFSEYAGISKNGQFLKWAYYEDYIKLTEQEIYKIINSPVKKHTPVICITTGKRFRDANSGAKYYGLFGPGIHKCCQGKYGHCGKFNETPLVWKYENEYHWNEYDFTEIGEDNDEQDDD